MLTERLRFGRTLVIFYTNLPPRTSRVLVAEGPAVLLRPSNPYGDSRGARMGGSAIFYSIRARVAGFVATEDPGGILLVGLSILDFIAKIFSNEG